MPAFNQDPWQLMARLRQFKQNLCGSLSQCNQCLYCHLSQAGMQNNLCNECWRALPWIRHACSSCGLPLDAQLQICADCLEDASSTCKSMQAGCLYEPPLDRWIKNFKDTGDTSLIPALSAVLLATYQAASPNIEADADCLILPIPLHWSRLLHRGFNQSERLATYLGRHSGIAIDRKSLRRVRAGASQRGLGRAQRLDLDGAVFAASDSVKGCRIILVDDVITTGATINRAAKALLAAGATEVYALAVARTPKPVTSISSNPTEITEWGR